MEDQERTETGMVSPHLRNEVVGAQLTAANPPSEIERFAQTLVEQRELISMLEHRLDLVSSRSLEKGNSRAEQAGPPHLSTLVDMVQGNNRHIQRLINEIVL